MSSLTFGINNNSFTMRDSFPQLITIQKRYFYIRRYAIDNVLKTMTYT